MCVSTDGHNTCICSVVTDVNVFFCILNWQDIIVLGFFSFGYFCGGAAAAILASGSWASLPKFYPIKSDQVYAEIANYISGSMIHTTCATTAVS